LAIWHLLTNIDCVKIREREADIKRIAKSYELYRNRRQFTGLKDKNGKKIWEGDIVKQVYLDGNNKKQIANFVTEFKDGAFSFYKKDWSWGFHTSDIQIIGNIYDNPELLEEL
jgi:uncharacterized phage protein (TIGR01671 family)